MTQPTLRVLHSNGISRIEADAAVRGVNRFSSFGLKVDVASVWTGKDGAKSAGDVYSGKRLVELVTADAPIVQALDLHCENILAMFGKEKTVFGLGITNRNLLQMPDNSAGKASTILGTSYTGRSGIMSLFALKAFPDIEIAAIEALAARVAGNILGVKGKCNTRGCLMGDYQDANDFVRRFARLARDLCDECSRTIQRFITIGHHD